MRLRAYIVLLALSFTGLSARADNLSDFTQQTMSEVVKIARAISVVQPNLDEAKYIEYALGIYRSAKRFDIDPHVLISIAQQETGFREKLPEGAAGEIGICQIRKAWLTNRSFRSEFGNASIKDLKHPAKNFLMAGWILRDLKVSVTSKTLPYWSFYNARKFENRFKYFLLVNRNIATLRRYLATLPRPTRVIAAAPATAAAPAAPVVAQRKITPPTTTAPSSLAEVSRNAYWAPEVKVARPGTRATYGGELDSSIAD